MTKGKYIKKTDLLYRFGIFIPTIVIRMMFETEKEHYCKHADIGGVFLVDYMYFDWNVNALKYPVYSDHG